MPIPAGFEDVRSPSDVVRAIAALHTQRTGLRAVVVKLDDSVAGDGNIVVPVSPVLDGSGGGVNPTAVSEAAVNRLLPDWYKMNLEGAGVVEERMEGDDFRSPAPKRRSRPQAR